MKILLVDPGASSSTADVFNGLLPALRRQGVDVYGFPLTARLEMRSSWLKYVYRRSKKTRSDLPAPTVMDALYLAAERLLPAALDLEVDWVVVLSGMFLLKHWFVLMRRAGLRVGVILTESPYDDAEQSQIAPLTDVVWTNERLSVPVLRRVQHNTHYLPHAFDPDKHHPLTVEEAEESARDETPAHDVVFVGTGFPERIQLLSEVDWSGIDLGLYGTWVSLASRHPLRRFIRAKQIPNEQTAALYRRAKIGLNLYRTSKGIGGSGEHIGAAESLNPRALELAACGSFHLSNYRAEVGEIFGPLVPTFTGPAELQPLVRHFLENEGARRHLEAQLPEAVAGHTFDNMARQVVGDLGWTMATQPERRERVPA